MAVALLAAIVGCGGGGDGGVECEEHANCNLANGGLCIEYAPTGHKWCQYPDVNCESGMRWSDFDTGDGLSGVCVEGLDAGLDAGPDARPDASAVDATADAGWDAAHYDARVDAGPGEWGEPEYVLNINTSGYWELQPSASADHLELYFTRTTSDQLQFDIYVATRPNTASYWGLPTKVDALAQAGYNETSPEIAPSKLEMFLSMENRIWVSTRATTSDAWGTPSMLFVGWSPAITGDGLVLYYVSGGYALKRRVRASLTDAWGAEESVTVPGDPHYNSVSVSADDLRLVLSAPTTSVPAVVELSRDTVDDPWGNLAEIATLTTLDYAPRDCDYFADANQMYCAITDGEDFDIFFVQRQ